VQFDTLKNKEFTVKSRLIASEVAVPKLTVGIRDEDEYDSERRLTKSRGRPRTRIVAVSRCLDCKNWFNALREE